ncbi:MAG: ribonuclease III [Clostridia bacterium]|nr:ribonuclease III [Clostridia bacterium]
MTSGFRSRLYTVSELINMPTSFLAYIGDTVFELHTRTNTISLGVGSIQEVHCATVSRVRAGAQAAAMRGMTELLTLEEQDLVRRARNAHQGTVAKHASMAEYRLATSFECLLGFLYLKGDDDRLAQLMAKADEIIGQIPARSVNG